MRKYTQRELLEEGFWSGVGKGIKTFGKLADYAVKKVAPEAQQLYATPWNIGKDVIDILRGNENKKSELSDKIINKIEAGLAKNGYSLDPNILPKSVGIYNNKNAYEVEVTDANGIKARFTVDENGKILTRRSRTLPKQPVKKATVPTATATAPTSTP